MPGLMVSVCSTAWSERERRRHADRHGGHENGDAHSAERDCLIAAVHVQPGERVAAKDLLIELEVAWC